MLQRHSWQLHSTAAQPSALHYKQHATAVHYSSTANSNRLQQHCDSSNAPAAPHCSCALQQHATAAPRLSSTASRSRLQQHYAAAAGHNATLQQHRYSTTARSTKQQQATAAPLAALRCKPSTKAPAQRPRSGFDTHRMQRRDGGFGFYKNHNNI